MFPKRSLGASSSSAAPRHEWEDYEDSSESPPAAVGSEQGSEEEGLPDTEVVKEAEAEGELTEFLLERHRVGRMTAKDVCIIGHWCGLAGLKTVGTLGMKPSASSGNFKRHLDLVVRKRATEAFAQAYTVPMPSYVRGHWRARSLRLALCAPTRSFAVGDEGCRCACSTFQVG